MRPEIAGTRITAASELGDGMYLHANSDFSDVEWPDPADAEMDWWLDRGHCPEPLPPLATDLFGDWVAGALHARLVAVNGYAFMGSGAEPRPRELGGSAVDVWDEQWPALVGDVCVSIRKRDYDDTDAHVALAALEGATAESIDAFRFTMDIMGALIPGIAGLIDTCTRALGREGPLEAMTILGGGGNATLESALQLEHLAELASANGSIARLVHTGDMAGLRSEPGAAEFVAAFDAHMETYGWRCPNWCDLHKPLWCEEPQTALAIVARYINEPGQRPSAAFARAAIARNASIARVEAALTDPAEVAAFHEMLRTLDGSVRVIEERAQWQMLLFAALRAPAFALGRALMMNGVLPAEDDVLYFSRGELAQLVDGSAGFDATTLADERRAALIEWAEIHPPIRIGKSGLRLTPPREWGSAGRADIQALAEAGTRVIAGVGVSRGVVTGRARVAATLEEAEGLVAPGDILVCRTTSPPWTPLFSIVGGVVADAGGMLSHAAITAREYDLPAVCNTGRGTRDIPDGATVTIDGAAGTVVIELEGVG